MTDSVVKPTRAQEAAVLRLRRRQYGLRVIGATPDNELLVGWEERSALGEIRYIEARIGQEGRVVRQP